MQCRGVAHATMNMDKHGAIRAADGVRHAGNGHGMLALGLEPLDWVSLDVQLRLPADYYYYYYYYCRRQ